MRLIDADKAISDYAHYGISHSYDAYDLEDILTECPTVEAIPKDQYEARLKANMVAMLKEIQTQAEENIENIYEKDVDNILMLSQHNAFADCFEQFNDLIQEKIDALKAEGVEQKGKNLLKE